MLYLVGGFFRLVVWRRTPDNKNVCQTPQQDRRSRASETHRFFYYWMLRICLQMNCSQDTSSNFIRAFGFGAQRTASLWTAPFQRYRLSQLSEWLPLHCLVNCCQKDTSSNAQIHLLSPGRHLPLCVRAVGAILYSKTLFEVHSYAHTLPITSFERPCIGLFENVFIFA